MVDIVQTLEYFQELLTALPENQRRVPVRIHPKEADGGQQHYMRGHLIGIRGENLVIIPLHGKRKEKLAPPKAVQLWESRLPEIIQKTAEKVKRELLEKERQKELPKLNNALFAMDGELEMKKKESKESKTKTAPKAEAALPPEPQPIDEPVTELEPLPEPEVPTTMPKVTQTQGFTDKLNLYKQLRQELAQKAHTEGVGKLRSLFDDLDQAKQMVDAVEEEIVAVCQELSEFGVVIPDDLKLQMQTQIVKTALVPTVREDDVERTSGEPIYINTGRVAKNTTRQYNRTQKPIELKDKIIEYFETNENYWASGIEVMRYCGETATPSDVLTPLVKDGTLEKMGVRAEVRYRLKRD